MWRNLILAFSYGLIVITACTVISCAQLKHQWKATQQSEQHELVGTWFDKYAVDKTWIFRENGRFKIEIQSSTDFEQSGEWQTEGEILILVYDTYADPEYSTKEAVQYISYHIVGEELTLIRIDSTRIKWKRVLTK